MRKKILSGIMAGLLIFGISFSSQAASREELAAINVKEAGDFQYWREDSPTRHKIVQYVEAVTNPNSSHYIPESDRIAAFDLDGTLYCETAPYYFQEMMFLHRVLEDTTYQPTSELVAVAKKVKPLVLGKQPIPKELNERLLKCIPMAYKGLTREEYARYVKQFMNTNEIGLTNLKRGEAYYLPMVEIVSYLRNNGFTVFMDSACEREILRCLVDGVLDIPVDRMIGSNVSYVSTNQGTEPGNKHFYDRHKEKPIRSDILYGENGASNKIFSILYEIGKQPVLAFGNSSGDFSMLEYILQDNPYDSAAFFVLCDDTERELGNPAKAKKLEKFADEHGWNTISMRDEFKTIYGDNVKVDKK